MVPRQPALDQETIVSYTGVMPTKNVRVVDVKLPKEKPEPTPDDGIIGVFSFATVALIIGLWFLLFTGMEPLPAVARIIIGVVCLVVSGLSWLGGFAMLAAD